MSVSKYQIVQVIRELVPLAAEQLKMMRCRISYAGKKQAGEIPTQKGPVQ